MKVQTLQKVNTPSVWDTKEWIAMQVAITDALKPHAEAWDAVAKALNGIHIVRGIEEVDDYRAERLLTQPV